MDATSDRAFGNGRLRRPGSDLCERSRAFALRMIQLFRALPSRTSAQLIGKQLFRSGTSVGAHIAEANRAKSRRDFISKIDGAMQELEESLYWMDLLVDAGEIEQSMIADLRKEANELMAIFTAITKQTKLSEC
jgi:four helix bundle protein